MIKHTTFLIAILFPFAAAYAQQASKKLNPQDLFHVNKPITFTDYFKKGLQKWTLSIDAAYDKSSRPTTSDRVRILSAPGTDGMKAVRFEVTGAPETFRAELALPAEQGWQERWYTEKIYLDRLPADKEGYIVMQWHAQMGDHRIDRDFPNLALRVSENKWQIAQAFGNPDNIQRRLTNPAPLITEKQWQQIIVHVRWSDDKDGLVQVWINHQLVLDQKGPNLYSGLAIRSPYFKTGIYCPSRKHSTDQQPSIVVYAAQIKIGSSKATYEIMTDKESNN
jgi:hypothetical protein